MSAIGLTVNRTHASVCLPSGQGLSLRDAAGIVLTAVTGRLWLTQEGDYRDIQVTPGAAYTIERDGLTLGYALEPTCVHLGIPNARRQWWREWGARLWSALVRLGEARARARMARGIYHQI